MSTEKLEYLKSLNITSLNDKVSIMILTGRGHSFSSIANILAFIEMLENPPKIDESHNETIKELLEKMNKIFGETK